MLAFAAQVIQRTAVMIAKWRLAGFAHGVMNTDNLNITELHSGLRPLRLYGALPPELDQ